MPGREHNPPDGNKSSTLMIPTTSSISHSIASFLLICCSTYADAAFKRCRALPWFSLPVLHLSGSLRVSLPSVKVLFLGPSHLHHNPSTLCFPAPQINQCWLQLSCNKSGPVLDWSRPSQPVTAWPSLRIN